MALSHLMRTLILVTRFYSGLFFANFLITLSCFGIILTYGDHAFEIIGVLFWFKIITMALVFFGAVYYKKQELYYYQNLGVSKLKLGIITSTFDFTLWTIVLFIGLKSR